MNKRFSKVFNDFHNECKRSFFLPNSYYSICLGVLLVFIFLWALLTYSYTHYPSKLPEWVYDVAFRACKVIAYSSLIALSIGIFGPFLVAVVSVIRMSRHRTNVPQNQVETPLYAHQDSPNSNNLSIVIHSDFETLFKEWFTTRLATKDKDLIRITGGVRTIFTTMKKKMVQIEKWSQTDLQRLGYILYHIGAVENNGENLQYTDWIPLFFEKLGRTDAPTVPDPSKFLGIKSNGVDFNAFKFLYDAAKIASDEEITLIFEEIVPPKAAKNKRNNLTHQK